MQEATSFAKKHNLNLTQLVTNGDKNRSTYTYTYIIETTPTSSYQASPSSHPPIPGDPRVPWTSLASARRRKVLRAAQHLGVHLRPAISYMKTLLETNSSLPLNIGRAPTGNNRIPNSNHPFFRCEVLVAGRVYSLGYYYCWVVVLSLGIQHWNINTQFG